MDPYVQESGSCQPAQQHNNAPAMCLSYVSLTYDAQI